MSSLCVCEYVVSKVEYVMQNLELQQSQEENPVFKSDDFNLKIEE